ncbi:MAG: 1-deoxy-D-xylulose-5-phosphate reductoisomerase [Planctomycetaceae bacterium]
MNRIAVLGSTGSIGTSCLEVIAAHRSEMTLAGVSANSSWELLSRQAASFSPRFAVLCDTSLEGHIDNTAFGQDTELLFGDEGIHKLVTDPDIDVVVTGIVGAAGLRGTWAALESGKRVAVANKETLVVAGPLVMNLARTHGAEVIPVDSEHSAVFQAMQAGQPREIRRIVLTSSGGPFRGSTSEELAQVTPESALAHPTWQMGPKITVDSATMMNKALEVIEARWLFGLDVDQIEIAVHPQSIVHSLVEFVDGSVIAQLSPPDMKLPIQYALTYPQRIPSPTTPLDFNTPFSLDFEPPNLDAFPALRLGFEVARRGGSAGAVLNAANEVAVERFLDGRLGFNDIPRLCQDILDNHDFDTSPTLDDLLDQDRRARAEAQSW